MHIAIGTNFLKQRVLVNLAIDGHRNARVEVRDKLWKTLAEQPQQPLHRGCLELKRADPAGELGQLRDQSDVRHVFQPDKYSHQSCSSSSTNATDAPTGCREFTLLSLLVRWYPYSLPKTRAFA